MANQNYQWTGKTWVDGNGFDTAQAQPQQPGSPQPQQAQQNPGIAPAPTSPFGGGNGWASGDNGGTPGQGSDVWGGSGQQNGWGRSRDMVGNMFADYNSQFGNIQKLQQDRQGLYDQYMQMLNNPQADYQRQYAQQAGYGAGQAEDAANQAMAYGGDPNAAALNAKNANAVQANQAASTAFDPRLRDQHMAVAMQMQQMLANPLYADMLDKLMGYDLGREGHAIAGKDKTTGFGDILGTLAGASGWIK